jgi:hypothetical protein
MKVVFATPYGPYGGDQTTPKAFGVGSTTPNDQKGVAEILSLQSVSFVDIMVMEVQNWYLTISQILSVIQIKT